MSRSQWALNLAAVAAVFAAFGLIVAANMPIGPGDRLLNVSYDPTRELYATLNALFVADYAKQTGRHFTIVQSHGGSSRQARAVISGEEVTKERIGEQVYNSVTLRESTTEVAS